jgi:CxxC motif-containing protein (DUF1111 family)
MTKWNLPEGRKPLTDADIAALTRRLAGTAVDYKKLYEAAKRDAEEAEAYAAELEAKLQDMALDCLAAQGQAAEAYQAQLVALEALELADAALSGANMNMRVVEQRVKAAIAELKEDRGASGE